MAANETRRREPSPSPSRSRKAPTEPGRSPARRRGPRRARRRRRGRGERRPDPPRSRPGRGPLSRGPRLRRRRQQRRRSGPTLRDRLQRGRDARAAERKRGEPADADDDRTFGAGLVDEEHGARNGTGPGPAPRRRDRDGPAGRRLDDFDAADGDFPDDELDAAEAADNDAALFGDERDPRPLRGHQARRDPPDRAAEDDDAPAHRHRQARGGRRVHRPEEAGPDLQDPQGAGQAERPDVRRGDAGGPPRRLRLPPEPRLQLPPLPRRHLRLARARSAASA